MERVRVDDCARIHTLTRGLEKLSRDLVEAVERTPYTVTSRQLLEELQRLAYAMVILAHDIGKRMEC